MVWMRGKGFGLIGVLCFLVPISSYGFFFDFFKSKPSFSIDEHVEQLEENYLDLKDSRSVTKFISLSHKKNKHSVCAKEALKALNNIDSKNYFRIFYITFGVKCVLKLSFRKTKNHELLQKWSVYLSQIHKDKSWDFLSKYEQKWIYKFRGKFYEKLFLNYGELGLEDEEIEKIVLYISETKNVNTVLKISDFWIQIDNNEMARNTLKTWDSHWTSLKVLKNLKSLSKDPKIYNQRIKEHKEQIREYATLKKLYSRRRYTSFLKHLSLVQGKNPKIKDSKKLKRISRQIGWIFYQSKDSFRKKIIQKISSLRLNFNEFFWILSNQGLFNDIKNIYKNLPEKEQERNLAMALKSYLYSGDYKTGLKLAKLKEVKKKKTNHEALFFSALMALRENENKWADGAFKKLVDEDTDYKLQSMYLRYRIEDRENEKLKKSKKMIQSYPLTFYTLLVAHEENLTSKLPFLNVPNQFQIPFDLFDEKERRILHQIVFIVKNKLFREFREFVELKLESLSFGSQVVLASFFKKNKFPLEAIKIMNRVWTVRKDWIVPSLIPIAFPKDYWKTINRYAVSGVDPYLILAIIRQESAFQKRAQSPARARGLMQLLVPTAREMARSLRMKRVSFPWDLFRPRINVKLGSTYLKRRIRAYKGHVPLALASYNAGPGRLQKWSKPRGIITTSQETLASSDWRDQDLWVEELPWSETRFYVKAVLRNYLLYYLFKKFEPMETCFRKWNCSDGVLAEGQGKKL